MKRIAIALLPAFLLYASPAYAWTGGPWDHNIAGGQSTLNGTFQGVISGTNITGIMIFGIGSTSSSGSTTGSTTSTASSTTTSTTTAAVASGLGSSGNEGRVALFIDGVLVIGQLSATMNTSAKTIAGVFESSRTLTVTTITKAGLSQATTNAGTTGMATTADSTYTFTGVETASGAFTGNLDKTYPDITFSASGSVTVTSPNERTPVTETVVAADLSLDGSVSADSGRPSTMFIVVTQSQSYPITVSGVKTGSTSPTFSNSITTQQSSVVKSS